MIIGRATCPYCGYKTTTGGISKHVEHCKKNIKSPKVIPVKIPTEIFEMEMSIRCLALELPEAVWKDVNIKWQKVKKKFEETLANTNDNVAE